ncbi:MAG: hypothetical protein DBX55_04075 [Verrucomicrobia bacterium]|nr:MAG: hypothetical protein DBX55_04075 [Verrucomicrobiota bacterium]
MKKDVLVNLKASRREGEVSEAPPRYPYFHKEDLLRRFDLRVCGRGFARGGRLCLCRARECGADGSAARAVSICSPFAAWEGIFLVRQSPVVLRVRPMRGFFERCVRACERI